jgi:hypothetical protein
VRDIRADGDSDGVTEPQNDFGAEKDVVESGEDDGDSEPVVLALSSNDARADAEPVTVLLFEL